MHTAYFDCFYGISGDMILGALIDSGLSFADWKHELEKGLNIRGVRISRRAVKRAGISGTRVFVHVDASEDVQRHLRHVLEIIEGTHFSPAVKRSAARAYRLLAKAEAKVHGSTLRKIHFHEVGCLDAIIDVAGSMLALEMLGVTQVIASPVTVGSGRVKCQHGWMPIPAPATSELLKGVPTVAGEHGFEMTTPTGAAILQSVCKSYAQQPLMTVETVGYGAGKREISGEANFLRVLTGSAALALGPQGRRLSRDLPVICEVLSCLVTDVDDMSPELLADVMERLFSQGALDVHFSAVQMKKNRPGCRVEVLCRKESVSDLAGILLKESSSFGLRVQDVERLSLERREEKLQTRLGEIDVKVGLWDGNILKVSPEYASCKALAKKSGVSVQQVFQSAIASIDRKYFARSGSKRLKK